MRLSQLFTKSSKDISKDEVSKNAELLMKGGYIFKEMAGVYSYLPLGLRVLQKIVSIIREEMNAIGGQEIQMTTLQSKKLWESTGRWSDDVVDVWFKSALKNGSDLGLAFTHEEAITRIMTQHIHSHKDLPVYAYQFQTKFRNETRAKSGIMRCREFLMKDLYSFSKDKKSHDEFYEKIWAAYQRIFERVGLGEYTYVTFSSGGSFSKFSHEFQTICDAGEDTIYLDRRKKIAINKEVYNEEVLNSLGLKAEDLEELRGAEVGNIFSLGERFSSALKLHYSDENGESKAAFMGSYGIGPGRVMGVIVELFSDEAGIIWPESVAPFKVHLLCLSKEKSLIEKAENIYLELQNIGVEVLFDDRFDLNAGHRLRDSDLLGMPYRMILSDQSLKKGGIELTVRKNGKSEIISLKEVIERYLS